jgi:hydrophobic/amphiphilic exporter-1 (mainly G- bacteria), HAE1 family
MAQVWPLVRRLEQGTPGLRIVERGRQKELMDSFSTLPYGILTAGGLIYVCLAWLFQSYVQPLVVMTAIPFAIIGMVCGHLVMGYSLTFLSLIGFIALTGIVVNDSLIFIEFYNHRRRDGLGVVDAAIDTGRARIRAILLTTTTTVPGLAPLMLSQEFQARFLIPMAITICFGLMASTVLVLLALPCLLIALEQIKRGLKAAWTGVRSQESGVRGQESVA